MYDHTKHKLTQISRRGMGNNWVGAIEGVIRERDRYE